MSDTENKSGGGGAAPAEATTKPGGMTESDLDFVVNCLQNTTSGSVAVDIKKVAEIMGFKNHRSVSNRLSLMRKKYGLPLGSSAAKAGEDGGSGPASAAKGMNQPAVPKTPSKQRVTKSRTPSTKKTTGRKNVAEGDSDDHDGSGTPGTPSKTPAKRAPRKSTKKAVKEEVKEQSEEDEFVKAPNPGVGNAPTPPYGMTDEEHEEAVFGKPDSDAEEA